MTLMDLFAATYNSHSYTLADFKKLMVTADYSLKREIDCCPDGMVVRRTLMLPSHCDIRRADLCFTTHDGMYAMMVDRPVRYCGTDPNLFRLFRDRMIIFDSWYDLTCFWRWLPYVD
ncbi:MAG: hypothetical protein Q4G00_14230 [Clostridia bacterium]|nr:hypothetical protein [Clostridia bacterium]